jgi:hypothetical protein
LVVAASILRRPEVLLVLALTVAWLPHTLAADLRGLRHDLGLPDSADARGPAAAAGTDLDLIHAARARIPKDADFAIAVGGRWVGRRLPGGLQLARQAGASWTQYSLAPRFQVDRATARWLLVLDATPASLGLRPRWALRSGRDWLVRLR